MVTCVRCGQPITGLDRFVAGMRRGRCRTCAATMRSYGEEWRSQFLALYAAGIPTQATWNQLETLRQQHDLDIPDLLLVVGRDVGRVIQEVVQKARARGYMDSDEERFLRQLIQGLQLQTVADSLKEEVRDLVRIRGIRAGHLPTVSVEVLLNSAELCYLAIPATYEQAGKNGVIARPGRFLLTSTRIVFQESQGGNEISLRHILNVTWGPQSIYLALTRQSMNGRYMVAKPNVFGETVLAATKIYKRYLVVAEQNTSRQISQPVKIRVWQRDGGQCAQCGTTAELQFDHIIPWSKGGAATVDNIQLLCGPCNRRKSNHI